MEVLSIDIETYSTIDLGKAGVYRYCEDPDFQILLFGYAFGDAPVKIVDLAQGEPIPDEVVSAIIDPRVVKVAFNAQFERICLTRYFGWPVSHPPEQWQCSQVLAAQLGLPRSLDGVAETLKLADRKDAGGKALIRYFSVPCKPTQTNGGRTRNLPEHDLEKWEQFKRYCAQDVEVERSIRSRLERFRPTDTERKLWHLDQRINDAGIAVDTKLVKHAMQCNAKTQQQLDEEARRLTGLDNPSSVSQLRDWLAQQGVDTDDLTKLTVDQLLETVTAPVVRRVLQIRQESSRTSTAKYEALDRAVCSDGRLRGTLVFYGASRSGRWSGRIFQPQNLPQNHLQDLDTARALLSSGEYDMLALLFDSIPDTLSQLVRTTLIPSQGCRFIVADFSAIEARCIAWLAGETWVVDTFWGHGRIYEQTAAKMFGVPIEKIVKGQPEYALRQKGKIAVLACGYGGAVGALTAMGALRMGLQEDELPGIVSAWRSANSNIVRLWKDCEEAAIQAVQDATTVTIAQGLTFSMDKGLLRIKLPSGRCLSYARPRIGTDPRFDKPQLTYQDTTKKGGILPRVSTFGGKIVENVIQGIARDCLAEAMLRLDEAGYTIVLHVHDEVVIDAPHGQGSVDEVCRIMSQPIDWAPGLPLAAEGFECSFYKKD